MSRFTLVLLALVIFSQAGSSIHKTLGCASTNVQADCKPCFRPGTGDPPKTNKSPDVTNLELDKTELHSPPPKEGSPPRYADPTQEMNVSVKVTARDPEGDLLIHSYTISGGRIIGQGPNVVWDLNGVLPGTYTITAGVDDGCGICGEKITKTVTVLENEAGTPVCICSEIRISPGPSKRSGDLNFSVSMTGPKREGLTYNWSISEGTLLSGQGTPLITVRPAKDTSGQKGTVTVEIVGLDGNCACPVSASTSMTGK